MKKMLDVYPNWLIGQGIFKDLEEFDVPWKSKFNSSSLDLNYYGNHSGEKFISPLVDKILGDDTILSESDRHSIASAVYTMNIENWKKLWDALHEEYDPLQNYNGDETVTDTTTETGSDTFKHTGTNGATGSSTGSVVRTGSESDTAGGKDSVKHTGTDTLGKKGTNSDVRTGSEAVSGSNNEDDSIYGFNSSSASPSNKSVSSNSNTTTYNNVTDAHNISETDTTTYNTEDETSYGSTNTHKYSNVTDTNSSSGSSTVTYDTTDAETKNLTTQFSHTFHREGNLGVTTSQQMLESEIELRSNNKFFEIVFKDIDGVLCLSIY